MIERIVENDIFMPKMQKHYAMREHSKYSAYHIICLL